MVFTIGLGCLIPSKAPGTIPVVGGVRVAHAVFVNVVPVIYHSLRPLSFKCPVGIFSLFS